MRLIISVMSFFIAAGIVLAATEALAVPVGGSVVAGSAKIANTNIIACSGNNNCSYIKDTTVTQTTSKAVIDWKSFNLLNNATEQDNVIFQQPNAHSITLNIINGGSASQIAGSITGNGQLWFVNPNGFIFGKGASFNAAGALVSVANITNPTGDGFYTNTSGNYSFNIAGNPTASVLMKGATVNAVGGGSIFIENAPASPSEVIPVAPLGSIVVQGPAVNIQNSKLSTSGGNTVLAASATYNVDFNGDGLVSFQTTGPVYEKVPGQTSSITVKNSSVQAGAGQIIMTVAITADAVLDSVINLTGNSFSSKPEQSILLVE